LYKNVTGSQYLVPKSLPLNNTHARTRRLAHACAHMHAHTHTHTHTHTEAIGFRGTDIKICIKSYTRQQRHYAVMRMED